MNVCVVMTCYNRKEKTSNCITSLAEHNQGIEFEFVVVDDASSDGTIEKLERLKKQHSIHIMHGTGSLFYSGGMRTGLDYVANSDIDADYILLVNDDVEFFDKTIEMMISKSEKYHGAIIAGATCNREYVFTYGPLKLYEKGKFKYRKIDVSEPTEICDSFNGNCVLIPREQYNKNPSFDKKYIHTIGDYDYGFCYSRMGVPIYVSDEYVGICEKNSENGTWNDRKLSRMERLKKKESVKGAPFKPWWHYLYKNFGLTTAVRYSISPYIRIMLNK